MRVTVYILAFSLSLLTYSLVGQEIELDRQIIGTTYTEYDNGTDFTLSASVGEPLTLTKSKTDLILSEGFQQSNYVLLEPLTAEIDIDSAACVGANDGALTVSGYSDRIKGTITYTWSNGDTSASISGLEVGTYTVTISGSNGLSVTNTARVSPIDSVDCTPGFYTGITPNNDGDNDYWHVDNADFFSTKEVQIFNRYGALMWETDNYNNFGNRFNGDHTNGSNLPVGTYYFIAKFDDSNYRGWIEISK